MRSSLVYDLYCRHSPRQPKSPHDEMLLIGARFRHGRQQAGLSQRRVAEKAGVSQSLVSRFERGLAPGMGALRVVRIAAALGPGFPFGCCPHQHKCKWPFNPNTVKTWFELMNG